MSGALIQIAAFGTQDIILMGNPTITFFKTVVNRHTNFAIEAVDQVLMGNSGFGAGNAAVNISRDGDLLWRTFVRFTLPPLTSMFTVGEETLTNPVSLVPARWTDDIGHHLIDNVYVTIGGTQIDKHYGTWLQIWSQLTLDASKRDGYNRMIGNRYELMGNNGRPVCDSSTPANTEITFTIPEAVIEVPLQFWFCRDPGLAIPLISLPYHEVRIYFAFSRLEDVVIPAGIVGEEADRAKITASYQEEGQLQTVVYANYVFLDNIERKRYAQHAQEYLIEQLQFTESTASNNVADIQLNFNHPTKELVWVAQKQAYIQSNDLSMSQNSTTSTSSFNIANQHSNYQIAAYDAVANNWSTKDGYAYGDPRFGNMSTTYGNPIQSARLIINGTDRVRENRGIFFNHTQPYMHHTCIPQSQGINLYSFALMPESIQPTGTINFSRIDNTTLHLQFRRIETAGYGYVAGNTSPANDNYVNLMAPYVYQIPPREAVVVNDTVTDPARSSYLISYDTTGVQTNTTNSNYNIYVFALNFNVLRIVSGMGGLAYAN